MPHQGRIMPDLSIELYREDGGTHHDVALTAVDEFTKFCDKNGIERKWESYP
jgi:hypothetical protein